MIKDKTPINATELRKYILDNNFENFKLGYTNMLNDKIISEKELFKYFNVLKLK